MVQDLTLTIKGGNSLIIETSQKTGKPRTLIFEAEPEAGKLGYGGVGEIDIGNYEEFGKPTNIGMRFTIKDRSGEVDGADFARLVELSEQVNKEVSNNVHLHNFAQTITSVYSMGHVMVPDNSRKNDAIFLNSRKILLKRFYERATKLIQKAQTPEDKEKFKKWINDKVNGVSASDILEEAPPLKIISGDINDYSHRKVEVIGLIEEFDNSQKICPQCGKQFPTLSISHNGKSYCSEVCKQAANNGNNEYTCQKCQGKFTDTPTIKDSKKYCSTCAKTIPDKDKDDLSQTKINAISAINRALNENPLAEEINSFKDQVLSNINKKRTQKRTREEIKEEVKELKNKTGPELYEGVKKLEKRSKTKEDIKEIIETKMTECGVKEDELGSEEKSILAKIKNKEHSDKEQFKTDKIRLIEFIYNKEIDKKIKVLEAEVEAANTIEKKKIAKDKILEILKEDNIYVEKNKAKFDSLMVKLNSSSGLNNDNSEEFQPRSEFHEDKDNYFIETELPGVKKEDIKIDLEENILRIHGERKEKKDKENTKQHYSEVFYGSFTREFILPTSTEKEAIKAHYENGILSITVPKSAKSKARTIKIE
ncbi:14398_t:CDS:2 [Funneliformis geosporum]|uniref:14398_t:CDS:1 n=1 Tax=Funneliformis geosporum TaxID=1117311 RepID=A0A9W4SQQ2_9GLOM|nr:14398_t:CDS:2 [Funneliformis geosporum]